MKLSIRFVPAPRPNASGSISIRCRVAWNGMRVDFTTGLCCAPGQWDPEKCCFIPGHNLPDGKKPQAANAQLLQMASVLTHEADMFFIREGHAPTMAEFRALIVPKAAFRQPNAAAVRRYSEEKKAASAGRRTKARPLQHTPAAPGSLLHYIDRYISQQGRYNSWADNTYKNWHTFRNHVASFMKWAGREYSLEAFDFDAFALFKEYCEKERGLSNVSAARLLKFFRVFLRHSFRNDLYHGNAHEAYRPRIVGLNAREVIFLSWEELTAFMTHPFAQRSRYLARARDIFCFCCFTGLRYSDVHALRVADVHLDEPTPYIEVLTKKTNDRLRIELNRHSLSIVRPYVAGRPAEQKALPVPSNQRLNSYLHEAARQAGLDEPTRVVSYHGHLRQEQILPKWQVLTSHAARRTFVVTALRLGIPPAVIMEWTGHADYNAMRPYIKIVDASKTANMHLFDTISPDTRPSAAAPTEPEAR